MNKQGSWADSVDGAVTIFVSDYGVVRNIPRRWIAVINAAPMRSDGEHYDMRYRSSRVARKIEQHLNNRARRRFMAGLPL